MLNIQLSHRFPADPCEVAVARTLLRTWLEDTKIPDQEALDIVLVFSELASNAVRAAGGSPTEAASRIAEIDLRAHCAPGNSVILEVRGPGCGLEPGPLKRTLPGPDAETGRGLAIADGLTDVLESECHDGMTAVRAIRHIGGPGVSPEAPARY